MTLQNDRPFCIHGDGWDSTSMLLHPFHGSCLRQAGDATHHCVCSDGFIVGQQVEMCHRVALTLEHGKNFGNILPFSVPDGGRSSQTRGFKYNAYLLHF